MYVLILYVLLAVCAVQMILSEENRRAEWIIYGIIAVIFLLRFSIGQDTEGYYWMFGMLDGPTGISGSHMMRNFGYTFLNYLVKVLTGQFRWLVLLSNLIILGLCTYTVYRHSKSPLFSLLLFVGSGMLEVYYGSGIKQGIAMAIYFFAFYEFLPKKKYLWYEICILLAAGFQEVSLILVPVPLLYKLVNHFKKHPYRMTIIISAIAWILAWGVNQYASLFEYMITMHTGYAPTWTHLLAYLHRRSFSYAGVAMELVFLIGVMLLYHFAEKKDWDDFRYLEILTFNASCVIYYLFAGYLIMSRTSDFIQIIMLVLIPNLVCALPDRKKQLLAFGAVFAVNFVLLYTDLSVKCRQVSANQNVEMTMEKYPYISVFNRQTIEDIYAHTLDEDDGTEP